MPYVDPNDPDFLYYGGSDPTHAVGTNSTVADSSASSADASALEPWMASGAGYAGAETPTSLPAGGGGGGGGGGLSPTDALKYLAAARGAGGGGGNDVMNVLGSTGSGAAIGGSVGGPVGAVIGGGIGLLGGLAGDLFGGGPSDQEKMQLEQQKVALQELKNLAAWHDGGYANYMNNPAVLNSARNAIPKIPGK